MAAGKGSRFGSDLPKQFCKIDGIPVLVITLNRLNAIFLNPEFSSRYDYANIVVLNQAHTDTWNSICKEFDVPAHMIVYGGQTRWESVKNAIDHITHSGQVIDADTIITVHDGARPVINSRLYAGVLAGIGNGSGCIPAVPVVDSLRQIGSDSTYSIPLDRASIRAVQTPQAFRGNLLAQAYQQPFDETFTDDASVMAKAGYADILLSEGDPHNIKITLASDLKIASIYLADEPST